MAIAASRRIRHDVRATRASRLVIVAVTPGSTAFCASVMSPCSVAPMFCAALWVETTRRSAAGANSKTAGGALSGPPNSRPDDRVACPRLR